MGMRQKKKGVFCPRSSLSLCSRVAWPDFGSHRYLCWAHLETSREGLTWAGVAKKTKGSHGGSWGCGPLGQAGPSLRVRGLLWGPR